MKKWLIILCVLCFGIVALVIIRNFPLWQFVNPEHRIHRQLYRKKVHAVIRPTFSFKNLSPESNKQLIDQPVATTGCNASLSLQPGIVATIATQSGGIQRIYQLYLPVGYTNTKPHAIVLNFHGYSANGFDEERISQFDPLADRNQFINIYPDGTFDRYGFRGWNTGLHPSISSADLLFLSNLLNQVQSNLCVNPAQIYATGFSNGGGFVNLLACKMSNRIAAFAPVSGSYVTPFKTCTIKRPVPIIEFHGTADETVPYNGDIFSKELSVLSWIGDWIKEDGCISTPKIFSQTQRVIGYTWPNCRSQASVIHYKIIGERHKWPTVLFPQTVNGKTQNVNAATIIWNFFEQHQLPLNANSPNKHV